MEALHVVWKTWVYHQLVAKTVCELNRKRKLENTLAAFCAMSRQGVHVCGYEPAYCNLVGLR